MVAWKKIHTTESLMDIKDDMSEAQLMAFSIAEAVNYETLVIIESKFKGDKIEGLKDRFNRPSKVAEYIYKKFKGDQDEMMGFITAFNKGVVVEDDDGEV